jgi:DNA (cytosine-5)-methyltransferase 1
MLYGSLFTGIGGLDLAIEEVLGARCVWQAESDPAARRCLSQHWPEVHCYPDVRLIDEASERPDIICGGFPCQDISVAGRGTGIDGARSGLWSEYARIVRVLRPALVFVENVPALASRGLDRVLRDLAALGFDAEWGVFSAAAVGAPHRRERLFLLAHADGERLRFESERQQQRQAERGNAEPMDDREALAHADGERLEGRRLAQPTTIASARGDHPDGRRTVWRQHVFPPGPTGIASWPGPEPAIRRGDARIPAGMDRRWRTANRSTDRLRLLGNACVPQQAARALNTLIARIA